jgi:hypothetical protein
MSAPKRGFAAFFISLCGMMIGAQGFLSYVPWGEPPAWVSISHMVCGLLFIVIGGGIGIRALFQKVGWDWGLALFAVCGDALSLVFVTLLLCGVFR